MRPDVVLLDRSEGLSLGHVPKSQRAVADVEQARLAADGERTGPDDLHARVLLGVVRGGDRDPAVEAELADSEIQHLRSHEPEVEHLRAGARRALDRRLRHRG